MIEEMTAFGFDRGRDGWSVEVEAKHHPDGTIDIVAIRQWRHDIEITPNEEAPATTEGDRGGDI